MVVVGEPVGLGLAEAGRWDPIRIAGTDHRGRLTRHHPKPTPPKPVD